MLAPVRVRASIALALLPAQEKAAPPPVTAAVELAAEDEAAAEDAADELATEDAAADEAAEDDATEEDAALELEPPLALAGLYEHQAVELPLTDAGTPGKVAAVHTKEPVIVT